MPSDDLAVADVYMAYPLLQSINSRMEAASLSPLPLADMKRVILLNKKNQHEEFHEILKNRYCVKFIMDKIKLFYLLDFDDMVWQSHMVLLLFKKARKYMLTAKIKVSYADMSSMKDRILEPHQLVDYIETETSEFEQLYSQFLKEVTQIAREEQADRALIENTEKPFELDETHFKDFTIKTVKHISQMEDDNGVSVANGLLDVYNIESYLAPIVDFREKEKHFENFSNRLTNRELRELVVIKLDMIN